jgi:putative ABC transport system permease protein
MISQRQVNQIHRELIASGVSYTPLLEELTDHICEEVEARMEEGVSFSEALNTTLHEQQKDHFTTVNQDIFNYISYWAMIKNYLKLGIRSLFKYKLTSIINLTGLIIGVTIFLLIGSYIFHENSFDDFHRNGNNIYRITSERSFEDGSKRGSAFSGAPWGAEIVESIPEVAEMVRLMKYRLPVSVRTENNDKQFHEQDLIWADNSFFAVFSFELLEGDPNFALTSPDQVVITQSTAKRYFGDVSPIGKNIIYENDVVLNVSGVISDFPINSHIQADIIGSFATLGSSFWFDIIDNWNVLYYYTYLLLDSGSVPLQTEDKIQSLLSNFINDHIEVHIQSITHIHTGGNLENELSVNTSTTTLTISIIVGLSILLLSIINYINLSNARALKRVKEVGVVKVLGSTRLLVFVQFMMESFILAMLSFIISLILVWLLLPKFSSFLNLELITPPNYLIAIVGVMVIFFVTITSGFYTALQMADRSILSALRANVSTGITNFLGLNLRKALITFQFMSVVGLISATLIIADQVDFLVSSDTGYTKTNIIEIPLNVDDQSKIETFKMSIGELTATDYAAMSSHRMSGDQLYRSAYIGPNSDTLIMGRLHIDYDFIHTFKMSLMAGRSFSRDFINDTSAFIINETAASLLGYQDPEDAIEQNMSYVTQGQNGSYVKSGPIVGVVKDFNFESLHENIGAMAMDIQTARNHFLSIKLNGVSNQEKAIKQIEEMWHQIFPNEPFEFFFVRDRYLSQYQAENQLKKIVFVFGAVSILISTLGLFGLTYFDTTIRSKEIGVRKVLGASTLSILNIFLKDYFFLIVIGFMMVTPIIFWIMTEWLNDFAFHIHIDFLSLLLPIILIGAIVTLTTSFTIIRAASTNPIDSLNHE